jgi:hypothetical protein
MAAMVIGRAHQGELRETGATRPGATPPGRRYAPPRQLAGDTRLDVHLGTFAPVYDFVFAQTVGAPHMPLDRQLLLLAVRLRNRVFFAWDRLLRLLGG